MRARRAQPQARGPTRPPAPPGLPQCSHQLAAPAPRTAAPPSGAVGRACAPPGPRAWRCVSPTSPSGPALLHSKPPEGAALVFAFAFPPGVPDLPSSPDLSRLVPPQPQAALYSLGVVLKRFCLETPAGGRGAVRTAVSTAARGGQRAFTQPSFPAPGVPPLAENTKGKPYFR